MEHLHPLHDPFLKGMIQSTDEEKAPPGFVFSVMRAVEQVPEPVKKGFSPKQLLSVILLGAAASITTIFLVVVPGLFNLSTNGGVHELTTVLPSLTNLIYSFTSITENINIPDIMGICLAVLIILLGVDALFRSTANERKKYRNTLFVI
jgi:magnesium-transporting ATPase (P-type)